MLEVEGKCKVKFTYSFGRSNERGYVLRESQVVSEEDRHQRGTELTRHVELMI